MKKILIVDDEEAVRKLVRASLRKCDYHLIEAEDGQQAIGCAADQRPDLIIMDLSMPGSPVDGLEAIRRIKRGCDHDTCKFLVLSGVFTDGESARAILVEAHDFLAKPFSPIQLRNIVSNLLAEGPEERPGETDR